MTNRYKKDKTFRALTDDQSYIASVASDSSSVETRLARVRTYMTENSSDSLANSLPRPSKCSCAEGSRSASTRLVFSPRRCNRLHEISVHDTTRCGSSVESRALSMEILPCSKLITRTHPAVKHAAVHKRSRPVRCCRWLMLHLKPVTTWMTILPWSRTSYVTSGVLQRRPLPYLAGQTTTNTPEINTVQARQTQLVQCRGFETIRRDGTERNGYCATQMLIG